MKVPILLPNIFDHPFTYKNTFSTPIEPGEFVKVSFGAKEQTGVVWDFEQKTKKKIKLKKILKKIDVPKINLTMIKFIKWFAKYNMVSLGMSLRMSLLSGDAVDKKFDEELDLTQGQRIRPNTLHETSKRIKQLYAEKGYLQADVSTRLIKPEETSTLYGGKAKDLVKDVIFTIEENGKVKIGNIIFEGNHAFTDLRLRFKMKETKRQRWYLFWRSTFDEKKYNEDLDQIQTFYRNKGYRDFKVLKDTKSVSGR